MSRFLARRPEVALVGAFGWLALILLVILKLASEIAEGDTAALDDKILLAMQHMTSGDGVFVALLRAITFFGNTVTLAVVTIIACAALLIMRQTGRALMLLIGIATGAEIVALLKHWTDRARPNIVPHLTDFATASFPSGHAANSAIVYLAIAALLAQSTPSKQRRVAILTAAMLLVAAIGLSRLFLGVHWPTDVLAGWIFGASWALLCWTIGWWLRARRGERL